MNSPNALVNHVFSHKGLGAPVDLLDLPLEDVHDPVAISAQF